MAALTSPNPLGYAPGDPVTSAQMNSFNTQLPKAPNFVDGDAEYNIAVALTIGGAGFHFSGSSSQWISGATAAFASGSAANFASGATLSMLGTMSVGSAGLVSVLSNGEISVQSGGRLDVESGGTLNVRDGALAYVHDGATWSFNEGSVANFGGVITYGASSETYGDQTLKSGASITMESGASTTLESGASFTTETGSTVQFSGQTTLASGSILQLSPARTWTRHSLRIANVSYVADPAVDPTPPTNNGDGEGPFRPCAWVSNHTGAVDPTTGPLESPFIRTLRTNTDTHSEQHYHWIGLDDLPIAGTISEVEVTSVCNVSEPTTPPRFRVVRVSSSGSVETMSALTSRSGSWDSVTETSIAITGHSVVSAEYRYALVVYHPLYAGGGSTTSMWVYDVKTTGTVSAIPTG